MVVVKNRAKKLGSVFVLGSEWAQLGLKRIKEVFIFFKGECNLLNYKLKNWYDRVDSNHRPLPCQGSALTN